MNTKAKKYGRRYPWADWFAKESFTLRRGKDFDCASYIMAAMLRGAAGRHSIKLHIEVTDSYIYAEVKGE